MSEATGSAPPSDLLVVGKITGCYGIKGWVKVHSYTEPLENFLGFEKWWLPQRGTSQAVEFVQGRRQGRGLVAQIAGVEDRNQAEAYRGLEVAVRADALPQLEPGDYYWRQLQGLEVWCRPRDDSEGLQQNRQRLLLGRVDHLLETGANDVLVVTACAGSVDKRERLVPYLPGDVVTAVDLERGVIEVDWFPDE